MMTKKLALIRKMTCKQLRKELNHKKQLCYALVKTLLVLPIEAVLTSKPTCSKKTVESSNNQNTRCRGHSITAILDWNRERCPLLGLVPMRAKARLGVAVLRNSHRVKATGRWSVRLEPKMKRMSVLVGMTQTCPLSNPSAKAVIATFQLLALRSALIKSAK